jgi:FMN phosphatase YigB (HAD superfamily)
MVLRVATGVSNVSLMLTAWPSAVLVDLDNTLHDYREAASGLRSSLAMVIEQKYGVPSHLALARYEQLIAGESDVTFASGRDLRIARMRLLLDTWPETRRAEADQLAAFIEAGLLDRVRPFAGALEAYRRLEGKGRTMILTEGYSDVQSSVAERLGLSVSRNDFIATKAHNVRKVDGSAFRLATEFLGVAADEIVMVGDNWRWDILGAAKSGLWQVWVGPGDHDIGAHPDGYLGQVSTFPEAPEFIAATWTKRTRKTNS